MQCRNIQGRAPIRLLIQFFLIIPQSLHTWCQIEIRMIPNEWQSHDYWCVDTVKHPLRITNKLHPTHIHIQRCTTNIQLNCSALATIWYTTTYVLILYFDWRLLYKLNKNDAWLKVGRQYSYMFNSILLTLDCHSGWMGWFQYWPGFHSNWNFFFYSHPIIEYATIQQHTERIMMTCSTLFILFYRCHVHRFDIAANSGWYTFLHYELCAMRMTLISRYNVQIRNLPSKNKKIF